MLSFERAQLITRPFAEPTAQPSFTYLTAEGSTYRAHQLANSSQLDHGLCGRQMVMSSMSVTSAFLNFVNDSFCFFIIKTRAWCRIDVMWNVNFCRAFSGVLVAVIIFKSRPVMLTKAGFVWKIRGCRQLTRKIGSRINSNFILKLCLCLCLCVCVCEDSARNTVVGQCGMILL